jgi:thiamine pyrophosphate-dependent acetolactate synthase large subunit-like protein
VDELSIKLAAPVLTTYSGRGLLPADHPCAVPGPVHATEIGALWDEADLVLAVGTDFDGMMTQNWLSPAPPKLVSMNVDDDDANKSYVADVTLVGDARAVLEHLAPLVPSRDGLDALRRRLHAIAGQVQEQVPLTIVLVDDRGYGTLRFDQRRAAHEPFGVDLVGPEFVGLARSFGVPACAVEGFGRAFEDELRRCVADGRRHMIVVRAALKPPPTTSPRWYRRT